MAEIIIEIPKPRLRLKSYFDQPGIWTCADIGAGQSPQQAYKNWRDEIMRRLNSRGWLPARKI